jgi:GAF domain-containing protein
MPDTQRDRERQATTTAELQPSKGSFKDLDSTEVARLFRENERRLTEMAIVNEIGQSLSSTFDLAQLLEEIHQQVSRLFDTTNFYIATYKEGSDYWTSTFHLERGQQQPVARHKLGAGVTSHIIHNRIPLLFRTREEIVKFTQAQSVQAIGELPHSWLGVPLLAADRLVGVMAIQSYEHENLYSDQDLALFATIAAQVANALENLRLLEEMRRRAGGMEIINELWHTVSSLPDMTEMLREIVDTAKVLVKCRFASIALVEEGRLVFRCGSAIGTSNVRPEPNEVALALRPGCGPMGEAVRTGQPVRMEHNIPTSAGNHSAAELASTRAEQAVPISLKGQVIGTLDVQSDDPAAFDDTDVALLQSLANQTGVAIENTRLYMESEVALTDAETLYNTSRLLTLAGDFQEILVAAAHGVYSPVVERALLWDIERGAQGNVQAFVILASWHSGVGMPPLPLGTRFPTVHFPATSLVLRSDPLFFEDTESEPEITPEIKAMFAQQKARSVAILPLWISGRQVGILMLQGEQPHHFNTTEVRRYSSLAGQMAAVVENRRLFEQTQQQLANLAAIQTTVARLTAASSFEEAIDTLLPQLSSMVQAETVSMFLCEEENIVLAGVFSIVERSDLVTGQVLSLGDYPVARRVVQTRQPLALVTNGDAIQHHDRRASNAAGVTALAIIPLVGREGVLGILSLYRYQVGHAFSQREVTLVQMLADQAATVFEKSRLLEQLQRRTVQLWTAADVSRAASSILDPAKLMQQVVNLIRDRFGLYYAGLFLVDEPGRWAVLRAGTGEAGKQMVQEGHKLQVGGKSMIGTCLADLQPRIALDVGAEAARFQNPYLPETHTELALPLISRGKAIGALSIQSDQEAAFTSEDIAVFGTMADQLANAVENARLLEEAQAYAEEQAILRRITQAVGQTLKMEELLETVLDTVLAVTQFNAGMVSLKDDASGQLTMATQRGLPEPMIDQLKANGLAGTLSDFTFQNGQTVGLSDLRQEAPVDASSVIQQGFTTYAGTPLLHMGQTLGTLCLFHRSVRVLDARDRSLLEAIGRQVGVGVHNAQLYQQTQAALAEVQATHRSYLRRSWQDHLHQRAFLEHGALVYEQSQGQQPESTIASPGIWRPEMELAVTQGSLAVYGAEEETNERSGLAIPITIRGQTIGVLGVEAVGSDRHWTEDDIALIEAIGDQLGQTLETARLFADTQRRAERERLIGEITAKIRTSTDMRDILETTAMELGRALGASRASVRVGLGEAEQH